MGKNFVLFLFLYMNAVRCLQRFAFSLLSGIGLSHDKTCACPVKKFRCLQKNFTMSAEKLCEYGKYSISQHLRCVSQRLRYVS